MIAASSPSAPPIAKASCAGTARRASRADALGQIAARPRLRRARRARPAGPPAAARRGSARLRASSVRRRATAAFPPPRRWPAAARCARRRAPAARRAARGAAGRREDMKTDRRAYCSTAVAASASGRSARPTSFRDCSRRGSPAGKMCTITSPASISTQSPCALPSIGNAGAARPLQMLGQRRHLPGRAAGRDDHVVGDRRFCRRGRS